MAIGGTSLLTIILENRAKHEKLPQWQIAVLSRCQYGSCTVKGADRMAETRDERQVTRDK
jgi:hypothetical protein